jgi:chromosome segregation ATPase
MPDARILEVINELEGNIDELEGEIADVEGELVNLEREKEALAAKIAELHHELDVRAGAAYEGAMQHIPW